MKLTFSQEEQLFRYKVMCNGMLCGSIFANINDSRICISEYQFEISSKKVFKAYAEQTQLPVYIALHPLEMVGSAEAMGLIEASPEEVKTTIWCNDNTKRQVFKIKT